MASGGQSTSLPVPVAETACWRPTIDDVDRISWGRNAKRKGTGSRGVPHRLNDEERSLYDRARRRGFVEIAGSGWRKQRSAAPLVNTYRSWCDARAQPAIYLHKQHDGIDELVVDLSPLRTPQTFDAAAAFCFEGAPAGGIAEFEGGGAAAALVDEAIAEEAASGGAISEEGESASASDRVGAAAEGDGFNLSELTDAYLTEPIYRLPMYAVSWALPRADAKTLAGSLAERLATAEVLKGRGKARGAPRVKPGKSRRHGGYGIG